jgi:hypothetical protein
MSAAEIIDEVIINDTPKIRKTIDTSFKEQQNEIFRRLLKIFNIESSENKIIDKTELEYHKDEIEMLLDDIIKYYHSNVWSTIKQSKKKYMSICRQLFKHNLVGFSSKTTTITKNNKSTKITRYQIKFN